MSGSHSSSSPAIPPDQGDLNGDFLLSPRDRLCYLARNVRRNLAALPTSVPIEPYWHGHIEETDGTPSPGRFLGQLFICEALPKLLQKPVIRVLDVGCGSGRMSRLLAQAGYLGTYVGVDIDDRFSRDTDEGEGFIRRFVHGDAHDLPETETFDLVFSNSALEHIPDDRRLLEKLGRLVAPGGMQVHIVPSGWGLALYLWHGYRQYPLARLATLFKGEGTQVYGLGGLACFGLHLAFISLGEILLRMDLRRRFPRPYRMLLNVALVVDRVLRFCPGMYVVCQPGRPSGEGREAAGT